MLNINCLSVVSKKEHLHALIDRVNPDIVVGTESCLKPDVLDSEIFPPNFNVFRKYRISSTRGGVFTAVSDELLLQRLEDMESELAEMLWIKIRVVGSKDLYVCSLYRRSVCEVVSMETLQTSLNKLCNKKCHICFFG